MPTRRDIICESPPCSKPRAPGTAGSTACWRSGSARAPTSASGMSSTRYCEMIDHHYSATPNGQKIAIMLENIAASWRVITYDIIYGDQLSESFGRINPKNKLPRMSEQYPTGG